MNCALSRPPRRCCVLDPPMSSSKADTTPPFRDLVARRLGRITWSGPDDLPEPSEMLREYAARLEAEALRVRKRAEEIEDTLAIVRECIAALDCVLNNVNNKTKIDDMG